MLLVKKSNRILPSINENQESPSKINDCLIFLEQSNHFYRLGNFLTKTVIYPTFKFYNHTIVFY